MTWVTSPFGDTDALIISEQVNGISNTGTGAQVLNVVDATRFQTGWRVGFTMIPTAREVGSKQVDLYLDSSLEVHIGAAWVSTIGAANTLVVTCEIVTLANITTTITVSSMTDPLTLEIRWNATNAAIELWVNGAFVSDAPTAGLPVFSDGNLYLDIPLGVVVAVPKVTEVHVSNP